MKLSLKNRSHSNVSSTTAALLCLCLLSACGLGTEVGNGAKDDDTQKKSGSAANNESTDGKDQDMNADINEKNDDGDVIILAAYSIDMGIIFNSCGSPFEPLYKMPFTLNGTAKSGKKVQIIGDYNASADTVVISDGIDNSLAYIEDDATLGDHKVIVTKKDSSPYPSPYVCSEVVEAIEDSIHSYSVILTPVNPEGMTDDSKPETTLSWVVDKTKSPPALTAISVTSEEIELLKLETDSE
jgi:hypothetical protein